ncbi:MAG TPA: DsbE family thiol:disulfide interchange protein [Steroidobacteraceae bacterium]|nr:DsbE family thiol:disulfide interchange protein [Steroidobacteraceae bacterium]
MSRYVLPLGGLAVLVVFLFFGLHREPSAIPSPLIGKPAPQFALPSVGDPARQVTNATYRGRMYVLNVWGTWCVGCREEHTALLAISRTNVVPVVGLNWKDDRPLAIQWLNELGNPYVECGFDADGRVAIDWGVYGAPETFLIDANGVVIHKHIAPLTEEIWQRDFLPRIRAAGGSPQ